MMGEWLNRVHFGDCLDTLRRMPDGIVQTCVTSPPYYGLRDYGHPGQIGLEASPAEFVQRLVDVFREVRRVLRDDGTAWVNMGDSYAGSGRGGNSDAITGTGKDESKRAMIQSSRRDNAPIPRSAPKLAGFKPKDLMGVPWMLAFALRADGWYLRQDIIWNKPNPLPESVTDRCAKAHEYIFLLSKGPRYYFDHGAIKEPIAASSAVRLAQNVDAQAGSDRVPGKTNGPMKAVVAKGNRKTFRGGGVYTKGQSFDNDAPVANDSVGNAPSQSDERNRRSVWTVATRGYSGAHFATFPEDLIEPCILAGAPAGGVVLDPFMGSGTTAAVDTRLGRQWIGCELNQEYEALQRERLAGQTMGLEFA
jgi:DNA modification methylase